MTDDGGLSPAGRLIEQARRDQRPKMSQRKAADLAGISDSRWRQLVAGYQLIRGQHVADDGPPDTLARMARVVGLSPDALRSAGREDAADVLERLETEHRDGPKPLDRLVAIRDEIDSVIAQMRTGERPPP